MGRWVKRIILGMAIVLVLLRVGAGWYLVRFGATSDKSAWSDDAFVADVLAALPE